MASASTAMGGGAAGNAAVEHLNARSCFGRRWRFSRIRRDIDGERGLHGLAVGIELLLLGYDAVAVLLGRELAGHPLASVNAQARALDVLVVDTLDLATLAIRDHHHIVRGIIGDRQALLK